MQVMQIALWIKNNVEKLLLIGPDSESEQWVSQIAKRSGSPFIILSKIRHGDKEVEVSFPDVEKYQDHTPILVDDIVFKARTVIETVEHLNEVKMQPTISVGIHAIFANNAYKELEKAKISKVITCNIINHISNEIDISSVIIEAVKDFI